MADTKFTPEKTLAFLIAKFAYLNDGGTKAQEVHDFILSKQPKR